MPTELWHPTLFRIGLHYRSFNWNVIFFYIASRFSKDSVKLIFKFIEMLLKISLQTVLIAVIILRLSWNKLCKEVQYDWFLKNLQRKSLVGVSRIALLRSLLYHIFQSMNLEKLHPNENVQLMPFEEKIHSPWN